MSEAQTQLVDAIDANNLEEVQKLHRKAKQYGELWRIFEDDFDLQKPIHHACKNDHIEILQYLIEECELNADSSCALKMRPIDTAAINNAVECLCYLIDYQHIDIHKCNKKGKTPLHYAIKNDSEQCKKILSNKLSSIKSVTPKKQMVKVKRKRESVEQTRMEQVNNDKDKKKAYRRAAALCDQMATAKALTDVLQSRLQLYSDVDDDLLDPALVSSASSLLDALKTVNADLHTYDRHQASVNTKRTVTSSVKRSVRTTAQIQPFSRLEPAFSRPAKKASTTSNHTSPSISSAAISITTASIPKKAMTIRRG